MKNIMKASMFSMALAALSQPVMATPDEDANRSGWHCTDTRDQYTFQFNGDRAKTLGEHPQHGTILQIETTDGWVIRISESQMESVYRCMKRPGEKFKYD